jgi:hypothetical protein
MAATVIIGDRLVNTDTFTSAGTGTTFDCSAQPLKNFTLQVAGTGSIATLWTVLLEGSVDNSNFTTILTHMTPVGDSICVFTGANHTPIIYVRTRVVTLTLGLATNIKATIVGV